MITLASKRYTILPYGGTLDSRYPAGNQALFQDTFASADLTRAENGVSWGGATYVAVVADAGNASGYAARFRYNNSPPTASNAELRFSLGAIYTELWIKLRLVIPANYSHTDGPSSDNNKLFRLWSGDTSDGNNGYSSLYVKNGASLRPEAGDTGDSYVFSEIGTALNAVGQYSSPSGDNFIESADFGDEVEIVMHYKVDTLGTPGGASSSLSGGNGVCQIWKNGVQMFSLTSMSNNPASGTNGWNWGYILGYANSPYQQAAQTVDFLLREFVIAETNIFGVA